MSLFSPVLLCSPTVWLRKCCGESNTNLLRSAATVTFASVAAAGSQINSSAPVVRKQFTGLFSFLLPLKGEVFLFLDEDNNVSFG